MVHSQLYPVQWRPLCKWCTANCIQYSGGHSVDGAQPVSLLLVVVLYSGGPRVNAAQRKYLNHESCDQNKFMKFESKSGVYDYLTRIIKNTITIYIHSDIIHSKGSVIKSRVILTR